MFLLRPIKQMLYTIQTKHYCPSYLHTVVKVMYTPWPVDNKHMLILFVLQCQSCVPAELNLTLTLPGPSASVSGSLYSYCSLKPLCSGMGEVVPARTSLTLHPPSPPTVHQLSRLAL